MAQLTQTNNYAGQVIQPIYKVFTTGWTSKEKSLMRSVAGINEDGFLPRMYAADDPIGAYTAGVPTESATVTYAERTLDLKKTTVYLEFVPSDWHEIWPEYASVGTMTNLALNPQILNTTLELLANRIGKQIEKLNYQGDTASGTASLTRWDGLIKQAVADADVVDVANIGVITTSNVFDVLEDIYQAIPDHLIDDDRFKIIMSTTDWRKAQIANINAKASNDGYLDDGTKQSYLGVEIVHTAGIPENTVFSTITGMDTSSNLVFGCWVNPEEEVQDVRIARVTNMSDTFGLRINMKCAVNYSNGTEVVLYQGL
jgi:hypothetical protein